MCCLLVDESRQLSLDWAQRVLDQYHPGVRATRIRILSREIGTTTRIRLAVDHDGPAQLPRRWFVKLPSDDWRARLITALPRLLQTEVRFYKEVAPRMPIPQPLVLATEARPGRGTCLVLEDVTASGARAGKPTDALTPGQARRMVEILARLHAKFQSQSLLVRDYSWLAGPVRRLENRLGTVLGPALMRRGLGLAADAVATQLHEPALVYASQRRRAMAFLERGPCTLVHHDCHPGNLYWRDDRPGLLDWQLLRIGEGIGDLAYLLATALKPQVRRNQENALLDLYRECLIQEGIEAPKPADLLLRYRAHLVYPLEAMLVTLAVGGMLEAHANRELIRRAACACEDQQAFAALPIESVNKFPG